LYLFYLPAVGLPEILPINFNIKKNRGQQKKLFCGNADWTCADSMTV